MNTCFLHCFGNKTNVSRATVKFVSHGCCKLSDALSHEAASGNSAQGRPQHPRAINLTVSHKAIKYLNIVECTYKIYLCPFQDLSLQQILSFHAILTLNYLFACLDNSAGNSRDNYNDIIYLPRSKKSNNFQVFKGIFGNQPYFGSDLISECSFVSVKRFRSSKPIAHVFSETC